MGNLLGKKQKPACEYCQHGRLSPEKDSILCIKKGIMQLNSSCSSFKYDPLKRKPRRKPVINSDFSPEDFKL